MVGIVSASNTPDLQNSVANQLRKARRIVLWFLCGALATALYVLAVHIVVEDSVDRFTHALPGYMFMLFFLSLAVLHYFTGVRGVRK
ncbi:MAG: hypothetical protein JWO55_63 [Candidatus Saccharibacteria bacterium]|nr:hypothetical protein [Candidatus Saccharibacteria bacterium]